MDLESSDLYTRRRPARNETIKGTRRVFVQFFIFIRVMRVLFRVFCIVLDSARLLLLARRTPRSSFTAALLHSTAYTQSHEGVPLALLKGVSFFSIRAGHATRSANTPTFSDHDARERASTTAESAAVVEGHHNSQ